VRLTKEEDYSSKSKRGEIIILPNQREERQHSSRPFC
jgi:hypothetical protein